MITPPTPEALDAARRQLVVDMNGHVRKMLDEALPRHPPGAARNMAVLIFEMRDPFVHQLVNQYVVPLAPPAPGQPNFGAVIIHRKLIPVLAAATTPEGRALIDCAPIMVAPNIPVVCMAFGGMIVAQSFPRAGSA